MTLLSSDIAGVQLPEAPASGVCDLCVVVLSYRNEDTICAAIDSLLGQGEQLEVVVSHSGGGPTAAILDDYGAAIRVVASRALRLPGAARNVGVAASRAPYVAFLAGDCQALPGWAGGRLERHRAGARAVASALVPLERSPSAWASFLLQHNTRMAHLRLAPHFRFGVSYARDVLEQHGPFLETLRHGEDAALNTRLLLAGVDIEWAPDVVTAHSHPESVKELLADQYRRGRLFASLSGSATWQALNAGHVLLNAPAAVWRASRPGSPLRGAQLARLTPLLAAGALATAAGAIRGGLPRDGLAERAANARRQLRLRRARHALKGLWSS
jgi:glycosyltransferase involved in cell wall biosynthesis